MKTKTCSGCGRVLPVSEFRKAGNRCKDCHKKAHEQWLEKNKGYMAEWRKRNRKQRVDYNREWRRNNPERSRGHWQKYRNNNRDRVREMESVRCKDRWANDPQYMTMKRLRCRVYMAMSRAGATKSHRTLSLIGCSAKALKQHIESQFSTGMSWENHSEWHIDHIVPCAAFDLTDPVAQKKCFNYANLRPLWAHENLSKGTKRED